jgi:hypothetical protein
MEVVNFSETLIIIYKTTRRNVSGDRFLHTRRRENLKSLEIHFSFPNMRISSKWTSRRVRYARSWRTRPASVRRARISTRVWKRKTEILCQQVKGMEQYSGRRQALYLFPVGVRFRVITPIMTLQHAPLSNGGDYEWLISGRSEITCTLMAVWSCFVFWRTCFQAWNFIGKINTACYGYKRNIIKINQINISEHDIFQVMKDTITWRRFQLK